VGVAERAVVMASSAQRDALYAHPDGTYRTHGTYRSTHKSFVSYP